MTQSRGDAAEAVPLDEAAIIARAIAFAANIADREAARTVAGLAHQNARLMAERDEARARLADLTRQATAAGPVLEAAEAWAACGGDALEEYALRRELRRAVAALRAAREGK